MLQRLQSSNSEFSLRLRNVTMVCFTIGLALLVVGLSAGPLQAAAWIVDAAGTWNNSLNWSGGVPNASGAVADFSTIDITADRTVTLDVPVTVGSLTFGDLTTATAGSWTIAGNLTNNLTLDNGGPAPTITVNTLGTGKIATISAPITGLAGFTKAGSGTLTLSGANSYVGTTTLSAGTLNINNATALGTSTLDINGGTTIDNTTGAAITLSNINPQNWNGDFTFTGTRDLNLGLGAVTINANRIVTVNAGTLTVGGAITGGASSLTKSGSGNLILAGVTNAWTGGTTVSTGVLEATSTSALPNWNGGGTGAISVATDATLAVSGTGWVAGDIDILRGSSSVTWAAGSFLGIDTASGDSSYSSNIATANLGVNKVGINTLALSGTNTYTGGTKVSGGVLLVPTTSSLPNWNGGGTGVISPSTGATLAVSVDGTSDWSMANIDTLRGNVTWAAGSYLGIDTTSSSPSFTYSNNITTANMGINKLGPNTLILSGINTYTGGNMVSSGTLQIGSTTALGATTNAMAVNSTLQLNNYSPTVGALSGSTSGVITTNATSPVTLTVDTPSNSTYGGSILNYVSGGTGVLSLVKRGTGTLTLTTTAGNASTYSGGTTIVAGTLALGNNAANNSTSNIGTGRVTFQGGTLSATAQAGGNTLGFPTNIFIDAGQTGTLIMSNRFNWGSTPTNSSGFVSGGGTLNLVNTSTVSRTYLQNNWNFTGTAANGDAITPFTGTLNISGSGTLSMQINNTPAFNGASWTNTTVNVDNVTINAKTNSGGNTVTIGSLSGTSTATLAGTNNGAGGLRYSIGGLNTNTTFSGPVVGNAAITKTGTGTLTLTGTNTNTGTTIISGGILQIGNGGATGTLGTGAVTNTAALDFNRTGTLTVSNAITGTGGSIAINGVTIYLTTPTAVTSTVVVNSGGVLGGTATISLATTVNAGGGVEGGQVGSGVLTLNSLTYTGAGLANFYPSQTTPLTAPLNITNALTTGAGPITVNILGSPLGTATYALIKYGSMAGSYSAFTMGTTPSGGGSRPKVYSLYDNSVGNEIDLVVGGADSNVTWTGAAPGGSWDTTVRLPGTTNWKYTNPVTGTSTDFYVADNVLFDDTGAKTVTISSGNVAPSTLTFNNSAGNDYLITGTNGIAGTTTLQKSGSGKLTISNNNLFTGATTINGGTISIASDATTGATPLGTAPTVATPKSIILNGGALSASATLTISPNRGIALGPVSGTGTGTIDVADLQTVTYAGVIANNYDNNGSSTSGLTKTGSGILLLNGANVFTGDTVVAGGTLTLGNSNALQYSNLNYNNQGGSLTFGALTAATIAALNGSQDLALTNDSFVNINLTIGNNNGNSTYSGALSGGGSLIKIGTGTVTLSGSNTYASATYVNVGSMVVSGTGSLNNYNALHIGANYSSGNVTFMNNATASLSTIEFGQNLRGGGTFTMQDNADVTVAGNFDLNNEIAGSQENTNNIISLNGGTLSLNAFTKTRVGDANKLATLNFNGTLIRPLIGGTVLPAFAYFTANVQAGGAIIDDLGTSAEIDQPLLHAAALGATPDGGLTKNGVGTLILGGNNTYTGTTTINDGTLQVGNSTASGLLGTGPVLNNGILSLSRIDTFTLVNAIGGTGSLVQQGYGSTAILTAANTYTGSTTVTYGTLSLSGAQATSGVSVGTTAGLAAGVGGASVNALTFGSAPSDTQTFNPNDGTNLTTMTVTNLNGLVANGTTTIDPGLLGYTVGTKVLLDYNGSIGGNGYGGFTLSLPPRITGSLVNNGGNTSVDLNVTAVKYPKWNGNINNGTTGDWDIGSGTLNWKEYSTGTATAYLEGPPADAVYFEDDATGVTNVNITTTVQPILVSVNNATKNYTFSGPGKISGATALIKTGTGTLTLTNTGGNDYTGGTKISAGTLSFDTGVLPAAPNGIIMDGGTLQWQGVNADDVSNRLSFVSGKTATFDINNNTVTFASAINSGTSALVVKGGVGSLTLNSIASSFTGNITVSSGTLYTGTTAGIGTGLTGYLGNASVAGRTITVSSGATLQLSGNDVFGNQNNVGTLPSIVVNGGTVYALRYNQLGNVTLNGGTLTQAATDTGNYNGYQFRGSVTVGGTSASTISTGNANANHLGANTIFDVADATGNTDADLVVSTVLRNQSGGYALAAGGLTKSGVGTMSLTENATYTGNTTVNAGVLNVLNLNTPAATVTVTGTGSVLNATSIIANTLTIGAGATMTIAPIPGGPLAGAGGLTAVPEPSTWAMLILAAMGLGMYWRRGR